MKLVFKPRLVSGSIVLLTMLLLTGNAHAKDESSASCTKFARNLNCRIPSHIKADNKDKAVPISVTSNNIELIGVATIRSAIPSGTVIGERFCSSSLIRTSCGENTVSGMSDEAESGYKTIIEEELYKTGYPVNRANNSVFEGVSSEARPAKFLIGATITEAKAHTIESENIFTNHSSWRTKAKVTVRWEVLDQQTKNVVYNKETTGESKVSGREVTPAAYEATRQSLRFVLADPNFVAALRSASTASKNIEN